MSQLHRRWGSLKLPPPAGFSASTPQAELLDERAVGLEVVALEIAEKPAAPADELEQATEALVGELLACAPLAVGHAKRVIDAAARPALATTLEQEVTVQELCAGTEDFAEGARAFFEKRDPEFAGR